MEELKFHLADYIVMAVFFLFSLAIGIYYGLYKKQRSTEQYLVGNRQMNLIPVAVSLMVTYQSAISVLGVPADIYLYNTMGVYIWVGIMFSTLIQAGLIVPLVYPLRITSVYEYYYRRFQSRSLQLLGTVLGMLQTLLYMSIVLYAPALALEAVADIPLWLSIIVLGITGTIYTSIGGIQSVIWTDVFQCVVLFGGLTAILIIGVTDVGGFGRLYKEALEGDRWTLSDLRVDPRVRHSVWSCLIGQTFTWLPNLCNQSSVQRISSMKSTKQARISALITLPLIAVYGILLTMMGLLLYGHFSIQNCDPVSAGIVGNSNQVMPFYVMRVLNGTPGLAGIFIAAMFSGALSSLSSGINAMAANTVQDILMTYIKDLSQLKKTFIAKLTVLVYGSLAVLIAYQAQYLSGPVTQMANTAMGAVGGPITGVLFLGATFPQANWIGGLVGGFVSITLNIWIAVGSLLYGTKAPKSELIPTTGCDVIDMVNTTLQTTASFTTEQGSYFNMTTAMYSSSPADHGQHLAIYDLSYIYFGLVGFLVSIIVGFVVSLCTGMERDCPTDMDFIFPCLRHFWKSGYKAIYVPTYNATKEYHRRFEGSVARLKAVDEAWYSRQRDTDL